MFDWVLNVPLVFEDDDDSGEDVNDDDMLPEESGFLWYLSSYKSNLLRQTLLGNWKVSVLQRCQPYKGIF